MLDHPAMTPQEIADYPSIAPAVRVTCYQHGCTLFVGDNAPEGGAEAVAAAAGCPLWKPLEKRQTQHDPDDYADCPVPAEIERLAVDVVLPPTPLTPEQSTATAPPIPGTVQFMDDVTGLVPTPTTAFAQVVAAQRAVRDVAVPFVVEPAPGDEPDQP